jgi:hypothetical protein
MDAPETQQPQRITSPDRSTPADLSGQTTRGKTARNRLRRVDNFVLIYDPVLVSRRDGEFACAPFVDVGFGAEPWTTLESAARLRLLNPMLPVLGVEIDPERVMMAQPYADALTQFRLGGFNLPLDTDDHGNQQRARLIRAFNVLREYDEPAVERAHAQLAQHLLPGGLLIEGTSDPFGRVWVANLLRKPRAQDHAPPLLVEGLLFSTNFRWGFEPGIFQPVLPKNYIHRVVSGEPIYDFLSQWKQAYRAALPVRSLGLRQVFSESARQLAAQGYPIDTRRKLLSKGYLLLKQAPTTQPPRR